jgi:hypothetical protein
LHGGGQAAKLGPQLGKVVRAIRMPGFENSEPLFCLIDNRFVRLGCTRAYYELLADFSQLIPNFTSQNNGLVGPSLGLEVPWTITRQRRP